MTTNSSKKSLLESVRQRRYLNKSFNSFRQDLLSYAQTYYPDKGDDFSDSSMGGMLLDMAAYVGDTCSFYLDHQFTELHTDTAVEDINIERDLRLAGVDIVGSTPAVVDVTFMIEVPAIQSAQVYIPDTSGTPIIQRNTVVVADNATEFVLVDDLDFAKTDIKGNLLADVTIGSVTSTSAPATFIMSREGTCVSGKIDTLTLAIGEFLQFRRVTIPVSNVTEIVGVSDTDGNEYYNVKALSHDVIFRAIANVSSDYKKVESNLEIIPAPYRYTIQTTLSNRLTTLVFGGGNADTLANDIIPDPSDFAIPLYGKTTFSRFSLDPNKLLSTPTLGVAKENTTLTINYRHGGGLSHNVEKGSINTIKQLNVKFPSTATSALAAQVRATIDVTNIESASGGDDPPTADELKTIVPSARNAQSRIVSKPDLIARVYTMPAQFGRVFRVGVRSVQNNPLAAVMYILSRDTNGHLELSPDTLKNNLKIYLNEFRMINDAIDIIDGTIINIGIKFELIVDSTVNKQTILQNVLARAKDYFDLKNFNFDQPIVISDVRNMLYNNIGVIAVNDLVIENIQGETKGETYSDVLFDIKANTKKDMLIPPHGGIFEIKFPDDDIYGVIL